MIAPRTILQMVEASRLEETHRAIVSTLDSLLLGVAVTSYPGKLDINDVVAKAVVQAPGVAVGWTRTRAERQPGGSFNAPVEWAAYIVAEDFADRGSKRRIDRAAIAHGIGCAILEILDDPDAASWGLVNIDRPDPDPGPALVPMFTARSFEAGTAYYAVTWRQALWDEGTPLFGEGSVAINSVEDGDGFAEAMFDEPGIPTEVLAMMRRANGEEP
tara:strand:- start:8900 stop:9547 length:648 start_codon:yes stop_codon:yes gene_type:complete